MKQQLWLIYYQQKALLRSKKKYADELEQLGISNKKLTVDGCVAKLSMKTSEQAFLAKISCREKGIKFSINNTGQILKDK